MAQTLTPKEIAIKWNTDARTVRKFLRTAPAEGIGKVGQGNRHAIDSAKIKSLTKSFNAWFATKQAKAAESLTEGETPEVEEEVTETE